MIRRSFNRIDIDDFQILYKTYIRPSVEYCVQAWSPYLVKDMQCMEIVQLRATKLLYELKGTAYEERLKQLGLTTLEQRRLPGVRRPHIDIQTADQQNGNRRISILPAPAQNTNSQYQRAWFEIVRARCQNKYQEEQFQSACFGTLERTVSRSWGAMMTLKLGFSAICRAEQFRL
jgi:hypothetical protein